MNSILAESIQLGGVVGFLVLVALILLVVYLVRRI
jgi:hypothetical protein